MHSDCTVRFILVVNFDTSHATVYDSVRSKSALRRECANSDYIDRTVRMHIRIASSPDSHI
jgi:hypothetical protein